MAVKTDACPVCGYPVKSPDVEGQTVTCVYCQTPMTSSITEEFNASPLFVVGVVGLVALIILGLNNGLKNSRRV